MTPHYLQHLFEETNDELAQAQERILLLGPEDTPVEKVTSFLRRIRRWQHEDRHIHVPMTRHDIADYLGLTTETVSRTFTQLRDQNVIRSVNQHDIELLDVDATEAVVRSLVRANVQRDRGVQACANPRRPARRPCTSSSPKVAGRSRLVSGKCHVPAL